MDRHALQTRCIELQTVVATQVYLHCKKNNIVLAQMCRQLGDIGVRITEAMFYNLRTGRGDRAISTFTLFALCDAVGLDLYKIISDHYTGTLTKK